MFAHVSPGIHEPSPDAAGRLHDPAATSSERTYATLTHLSLLTVHVLVPVLPALVMWLIKRHDSPFLDDHGKEAVNFQISLTLYALACVPLTFLCGIGFALGVAVYVLGIVGMITSAVAANRGDFYRYPACIRLVT